VGHTTDQIESTLERTREDLGAHLEELGQKVRDVTDWHYHFQNNPLPFVAAAFGGGILLATMLQHPPGAPASSFGPNRHPLVETWGDIKDALWRVAASRVTNFVEDVVPGFAQEYRAKRT
jgi:hypothetical protein